MIRELKDMCEACNQHNKQSCGFEERGTQYHCPYNDLIAQGYELAEKDMELTWQDAQNIFLITRQYMNELDHGYVGNFPSSTREMYEEVLRRFREHKK